MSYMLKKYGVATQVDGIPLITRGAVDFKANPTLAAGDVTISKDGGAFANVEGADAFASYVAVVPTGGVAVQVKLHAADVTCKKIFLKFQDQTSPKEWEDNGLWIYTYGHANAHFPFDFDVNQTGDAFAIVNNGTYGNSALNTAIGTRSSHSAADVWAVGTRTLTSFGTLIASIWTYATRTITGGTIDGLGPGTTAKTYTVYESDGVTPLEGVLVILSTTTDCTGTVWAQYSNSLGATYWRLNSGTTYYLWRFKADRAFTNPDTETA